MRPKKIDAAMARDGHVPVSAFCRLTGMQPSTVYRAIDGAHISARRAGSHWYVSVGSIAARYPVTGLFDRLTDWARFTAAGRPGDAAQVLARGLHPDEASCAATG